MFINALFLNVQLSTEHSGKSVPALVKKKMIVECKGRVLSLNLDWTAWISCTISYYYWKDVEMLKKIFDKYVKRYDCRELSVLFVNFSLYTYVDWSLFLKKMVPKNINFDFFGFDAPNDKFLMQS